MYLSICIRIGNVISPLCREHYAAYLGKETKSNINQWNYRVICIGRMWSFKAALARSSRKRLCKCFPWALFWYFSQDLFFLKDDVQQTLCSPSIYAKNYYSGTYWISNFLITSLDLRNLSFKYYSYILKSTMMAAEINVAAKFSFLAQSFWHSSGFNLIFIIARSIFKQGFTIHRRMFTKKRILG